MPTPLDLAPNLTGAGITEAQGKTWLTNERAALAEMGDPLGMPGAIQNLSLAFSVAASALTIAYKTRAGVNASATDPISAAMRNATLATGDFNVRNIIAALSLIVPSTATLGHTSAVAGDLYHYLIDNAGTLEPAVSMKYFGQQGIVSTTTIAAASNSATTMYSTTGRSNVAFRCVGHTIDTQATAGTWAAVPTTSELAPFDVAYPPVIKRKTADESVTSSTALQDDDHLTFPIGANEEWVVSYDITFGNGMSTTGLKFSVTGPTGCTVYASGIFAGNAAGTGFGSDVASASGTLSILASTGAFAGNTSVVVRATARIVNGANAGSVALQWAQNTSSGTALTAKAGGQMIANRFV